MAKEIWQGSIAFGLVEIPVALVVAEKSEEVGLSYLDRRDFSPVGYKRYNKTTDKEVAWDDIVRGYEYEKGEYVVLTPQDLARASPERSRTIEIVHFVDAGEIDSIYYEKPYYLQPLKPRSKGYVLLREILKRTGKVGIAKVVVRTREHVAAVGVRGDALVLQLLRFASEIRPPDDLENVDADLKEAKVQPKEIEIAERLVKDMTAKWHPEAHKDEYAEDLRKLVEEKVASGDMHTVDTSEHDLPRKQRSEPADLLPLLRKSLERGGASAARSRDGRGVRTPRSPRVRGRRQGAKPPARARRRGG